MWHQNNNNNPNNNYYGNYGRPTQPPLPAGIPPSQQQQQQQGGNRYAGGGASSNLPAYMQPAQQPSYVAGMPYPGMPALPPGPPPSSSSSSYNQPPHTSMSPGAAPYAPPARYPSQMQMPSSSFPGANQGGGAFVPSGMPSSIMPPSTSSSSTTTTTTTQKPKIEQLVMNGDESLSFLLLDADVSMANALRRVMIAETPTLAIDEVVMQENNTALHDEFIAHRLGMLPINVTDGIQKLSQYYDYPFQCRYCMGSCPRCKVRFTLDVANDGPEAVRTVYSSDLLSADENVRVMGYSSKEEREMLNRLVTEEAAGKGIVIAKLGIGERLKLECWATKGIGKMHHKWSPVAVARYTFEPRVRLNEQRLGEITEAEKREFAASCPTKVYQYDERTKRVVLANEANCIFCDNCVKVGRSMRKRADDDNVVVIEPQTSRFRFTVETNGALLPKDIVLSALAVLNSKFTEIRTLCEEIQQKSGGQSNDMDALSAVVFKDTGGFI